MFVKQKIETGLFGSVGFRQPIDPSYPILDSGNIESRSGYYVNDNPFASVENLKDTQDYKDADDSQFNTYLSNIQTSSIANVCNQVFNDYDFIDSQVLYKNAMNKVNVETLPDGFVGYKIRITDEKSVAFKISKVFLDFQGTGDVELLLFNSNKLTPLFSETITISSDHQVEELNWVIDDSNDTYKGEYYLGYNTQGLTVSPFKRDYNNSDIMSSVTHLGIEKISVPNHNTNTLFDLTKQSGLSQTTGINPYIQVYDDFTDVIIQNQNLFSRAIYLDMCVSAITRCINSKRSNYNERNADRDLKRMIAEVEGLNTEGGFKIKGLKPQLKYEISQIREELKKLKEGFFIDGLEVITLD